MSLDQGALGVLEVSSIGRGIAAADLMLKMASVEIQMARPVCPGKYLIMVRGSVSHVADAVERGTAVAGDALIDSLVLPRPHASIGPAISQTTGLTGVRALGVVECYTLCAAIQAADQAAKGAAIDLIEVRLAIMMAGKGFVTFSGDEAAVQSAVDLARAAAAKAGMLTSAIVIPRPADELIAFLV